MGNHRKSYILVYSMVTVVLAVTTFLSPAVYGSWWFVALWGVFAATLFMGIVAAKMWRHAGTLLLHISFLAMLGGGLLTYLTKSEGHVKIEPGQTVSTFQDVDGEQQPLPAEVALEQFETLYYPGDIVPRDYVSHLEINGKKEIVSMNNILDLNGYHLLQYSYDEKGATVLSVNHDPYGMILSYAGYLMFAIGGLLILLSKGGRFRQLLRKVSVALVLFVALSSHLNAEKIAGIPIHTADSLKSRQVLYNGRVVTFNTLARDVLMKIHGSDSYRGLTAEQTLLSLKLFPEKWKNEPLIKIKEKAVSGALGVSGKYVGLADLFDEDGNYRVEKLYDKLGQQNVRAVEDLDEKVGIILTLYSDELIVARPEDIEPLSDMRVRMELLYNSIPFTKIVFILLFLGFFSGMAEYLGARIKWLGYALLAAATILSVLAFAFEWYLSARLPLANTFETLQFAVLVIEILLLSVGRRNRLLMSVGLLLSGALALVAHLVASNPVVTQLMPVLNSGWLSLHVSLVMTSYAILGFTFIIAIVGLVVQKSADRMRMLSMTMLYPGVYLLGLGIFTGAVWANVSWGQYWSWDPKETWALITLFVYALPLHTSFRLLTTNRRYHQYMIFAILSIAMTYFGVNHLNSLHAYN